MKGPRRRSFPASSRGTIAALVAIGLHVALGVALAWRSTVALGVLAASLALAAALWVGGRVTHPTFRGRRSRRGDSRTRMAIVAPLAAAMHFALLALALEGAFGSWEPDGHSSSVLAAADRASSSASANDDAPIEIQSLVDELRQPDEVTPAERREEEKRKEEEEKKDGHGQVVDIARPPLEQRPEHADYAAEYDSAVEHQTRGKAGRGEAGARLAVLDRARPTEPRRPPAPAAPDGNPLARPGRPGPHTVRTPAHVPSPTGQGGPDGIAPGEDDREGLRRPGAPGAAQRPPSVLPGEEGVPGRPGRPNLAPTEEMLARAIGRGGGSSDYLKDVDEGDATALNAKKWKYASFFNRVKRAVADEWHPDTVYLRHDPSGNVYGNKDRVTVLRVHLHSDGRVESLSMLQASGVEFLDDEAMDAFRRAQPFVNPPPQLVSEDGLIHFNFGFIFELSGHTSFRFFKYQ